MTPRRVTVDKVKLLRSVVSNRSFILEPMRMRFPLVSMRISLSSRMEFTDSNNLGSKAVQYRHLC